MVTKNKMSALIRIGSGASNDCYPDGLHRTARINGASGASRSTRFTWSSKANDCWD